VASYPAAPCVIMRRLPVGANAACTVRVVGTDEDLMIARHTRAVLQGGGG